MLHLRMNWIKMAATHNQLTPTPTSLIDWRRNTHRNRENSPYRHCTCNGGTFHLNGMRSRETRRHSTKCFAMNLVMSSQVIGSGSAIITIRALVRPLICVNSFVSLQMRRAVRLIGTSGICTMIQTITVRGHVFYVAYTHSAMRTLMTVEISTRGFHRGTEKWNGETLMEKPHSGLMIIKEHCQCRLQEDGRKENGIDRRSVLVTSMYGASKSMDSMMVKEGWLLLSWILHAEGNESPQTISRMSCWSVVSRGSPHFFVHELISTQATAVPIHPQSIESAPKTGRRVPSCRWPIDKCPCHSKTVSCDCNTQAATRNLPRRETRPAR